MMIQNYFRVFLVLFSGYLASAYWIVNRQRSYWYHKIFAASAWAGLAYGLLGVWNQWKLPLGILVLGLLVEFSWKRKSHNSRQFLYRQLIYFLGQLILTGLIISLKGQQESYWLSLYPGYFKVLLCVSGICAGVFGAAPLVGAAVQPYQDQISITGEESPTGEIELQPGLYGGGKMIGMLERSLVFLFVAVEEPAGIGFLIAAKSILRLGEIQGKGRRREVEYIIIGTFFSLLLGLAAAYLVYYLADLI
jgi:hypothetical protein